MELRLGRLESGNSSLRNWRNGVLGDEISDRTVSRVQHLIALEALAKFEHDRIFQAEHGTMREFLSSLQGLPTGDPWIEHDVKIFQDICEQESTAVSTSRITCVLSRSLTLPRIKRSFGRRTSCTG